MDEKIRDELRAKFELQIKYSFYQRPEFPFLQSMGTYHVFFPVQNEEHDFGFLILEWEPKEKDNWIGTWVNNEEELNNYKYKRESPQLKLEIIVKLFAERMAQAHHKQMMKQKAEQEDDWRNWDRLQGSDPKPYLN